MGVAVLLLLLLLLLLVDAFQGSHLDGVLIARIGRQLFGTSREEVACSRLKRCYCPSFRSGVCMKVSGNISRGGSLRFCLKLC
jgi:hypothetical protein